MKPPIPSPNDKPVPPSGPPWYDNPRIMNRITVYGFSVGIGIFVLDRLTPIGDWLWYWGWQVVYGVRWALRR